MGKKYEAAMRAELAAVQASLEASAARMHEAGHEDAARGYQEAAWGAEDAKVPGSRARRDYLHDTGRLRAGRGTKGSR